MNDRPENLGEKLKELRNQNNYSQNSLAEELGVSRQTVSHWETGKIQPPVEALIALCKLYQISLDELVGIQSKEDSTTTHEPVVIESSSQAANDPLIEQLCLVIVLAASTQIGFLNIIIPIVIMIWMHYKHRKYKAVFVLCFFCLLLGLYDLYVILVHIFDWGYATIEAV